jgi:PTH1 family peptidyl-tRNA hydrolase
MGLGNPGAQYAANRHNVGQMVVDELAARLGTAFKTHKTPSRVAEGFLRPGGPKLVLAKSNSYMNTSGGPVSALLKFYGLGPDRLIVVHDELDIPFERLKLGTGGGPGGHNGVRSVISALGDPGFPRVRIGVGRPPPSWDPADYVLANFTRAEAAALTDIVGRAADAVEAIAALGITAAMNKFNTKPQSGKNSAKDNDNRG